jgi:hypothetical protein
MEAKSLQKLQLVILISLLSIFITTSIIANRNPSFTPLMLIGMVIISKKIREIVFPETKTENIKL